MRKYEYSNKFKKDIKKAQKQTSPKRDIEELKKVMRMLAEDKPLSPEKRDHLLNGGWACYRECHVQPDFLLIYKKNDKEWNLLRNEDNVMVITIDDLDGVPANIQSQLRGIKDEPLKGDVLRLYNANVKIIVEGLQNNTICIKSEILTELDLM